MVTKTKLAPLHIAGAEPEKLRIDIGCGVRCIEGFAGIDSMDFGQKYIHDVRKGMPFEDNSVDEVHSSHFVEHLTGPERVMFFNELYRVMKIGAIGCILYLGDGCTQFGADIAKVSKRGSLRWTSVREF